MNDFSDHERDTEPHIQFHSMHDTASECLSMLLWGERVPSVDTLVRSFGKLVQWRNQYRRDPGNEALRLAIADLESACRSLADSLERQSNVC